MAISGPQYFVDEQSTGGSLSLVTGRGFTNSEVDKRAVAKAFSRAATHYDQLARLQQLQGEALLNALEATMQIQEDDCSGRRCLDLGAGTGLQTAELKNRLSPSSLIALDIAGGMCQELASRNIASVVIGDFDQLPIRSNSIDVVYSNFALQWSNSVSRLLQQIARCLDAGGLFAFNTLVEGSMREIDLAWQTVDSERHSLAFGDATYWKSALSPHFEIMDCSEQTVVDLHADLNGLLASVKGIGASNHQKNRSAKTMTRSRHLQFLEGLKQTSAATARHTILRESSCDAILPESSNVPCYGLSYQVLQVVCKRI